MPNEVAKRSPTSSVRSRKTYFASYPKHPAVVIFVLTLVIYLPVYVGAHYLFHDDWATFWWDKDGPFWGHPIFNFVFTLGRPLGAILLVLFTHPINNISDANLVRFVLVTLLAIFAIQLFVIFQGIGRRYGTQDRLAHAVAALAIVCLPAFNTYVAYISNGLDIVACIIGLLAYQNTALAARNSAPGTLRILCVTNASIAGLAALMIYPPGALLIFLPPGLQILLCRRSELGRTTRELMIFVAAALIPFVLYFAYFRTTVGHHSYASVKVAPRLILQWLLRQELLATMNLWNIFVSVWAALIVFAVIVSALAVTEWRRREEHNLRQTLIFLAAKLFGLSGLACVMSGPNMFSSQVDGNFVYRANPGAAALAVLVLVYATYFAVQRHDGQRRLSTAFAVVLAIFGAGFAYFNTYRLIVAPTTKEIGLIRHALAQADLGRIKQIHLIIPEPGTPSPIILYPQVNDEFGLPLTSMRQDVLPMLIAVLRDAGIQTRGYTEEHRSNQLPNGAAGLPNGMIVTFGSKAETERTTIKQPVLFVDLDQLARNSDK